MCQSIQMLSGEERLRAELAALATLAELDPAAIAEQADAVIARLEDSAQEVRYVALETLGKLEPETLAQHADAVVARLEDSDCDVRKEALMTLGKLEPATLAQYADPVVSRLEDSGFFVRAAALSTLRKLEPEALAQHASAVIPRLEDSKKYHYGCDKALTTLNALPLALIRDVDLRYSDGRSRLLGRLAWYNYSLRVRVKRIALYWYALPYRPSGPGHARDVAAWDQMNKRSRLV